MEFDLMVMLWGALQTTGILATIVLVLVRTKSEGSKKTEDGNWHKEISDVYEKMDTRWNFCAGKWEDTGRTIATLLANDKTRNGDIKEIKDDIKSINKKLEKL